jgi:polyphosphate kinase
VSRAAATARAVAEAATAPTDAVARAQTVARAISDSVATPSADGLTPAQQLAEVNAEARALIADQQAVWTDLHGALRKQGIAVVTGEEITAADRTFLDDHFAQQVFPVLTPLAIDPAHPFPFIPNLGFTIAVQLTNKRDNKNLSALIPVPSQLRRFIRLPDTAPKNVRFIPLEHVIALYFDRLFPGHGVTGWGMFRLLRDSDVEVEEEAEDLVLLFERLLKRRRRGSVIHMIVTVAVVSTYIELTRLDEHAGFANVAEVFA